MNKVVLKARSGSYYLKIQVSGKPTIIIFETQEWIIDYIFEKLDIITFDYYRTGVLTFEGYSRKINYLAEKCTIETYPVFFEAYRIKNKLYEYWAAFFEESEYDGDYGDWGQYDPMYYDIRNFE